MLVAIVLSHQQHKILTDFVFVFVTDCSIGASVWRVAAGDCVFRHPEGWVSAEVSDYVHPEQH